VMPLSVILISSKYSEESVGSSTSQVILFGTLPAVIPDDIPTIVLAALEAEAAVLASPVGVLDLVVAHSSSSSSAPVETTIAPPIVVTSPIRDSTGPVIKVSPVPQVVHRRTRITVRKSVRGYRHVMTPAYSVALRLLRASALTHSYKTSSSDPSSHSSDFSSLSETVHTPSGPLPRRRPKCSDYVTPSSSTLARPSRKRCRSSATSVPTPAHPSGALSPVRANLLPLIQLS
ncbi:hypothetical protein Tco_0701053, partial [Tanacetum coccineum]